MFNLLIFLSLILACTANPITITGDIKSMNDDLFNFTLMMSESEEKEFMGKEFTELLEFGRISVNCQYKKIYLVSKTIEMCFLKNVTYNKFNIMNIEDTWDKVSFLTIEDSSLITVPENLMHTFPFMTHLTFINAGIERITAESFQNGAGLQVLSLSNNTIRILPNGGFEELPLLSSLKLPSNKIEEIQVEAFRGLSELTNLNLDKNNLKILKSKVFMPLKNLIYLSIVDNQLQSIPPKLFMNNPDLSGIILVNNDITLVAEDVIEYINELHFLDLRNNTCTDIFINFHHQLSTRQLYNDLMKNC